MTHMRYWAMSMASALCGGFLAINRFAFASGTAVWIAFGVAIGATVVSLAAFAVALLRENQAFSGLSAIGVLVGAWSIVATRIFTAPDALWLAFAGGVMVLLVSLRALALHETTVERVVYALDAGSPSAPSAPAGGLRLTSSRGMPIRGLAVSAPMRSWAYWLIHIGLGLAGAFVVLMTFALSAPEAAASPRWVAFGVGIAAACAALSALALRGLAREAAPGDGARTGRLPGMLITADSAAVAIAMIVTMSIYTGNTARWVAFALGCALVGLSLLATVVHEITSERVRHEVEIAKPATAPAVSSTAPAA
jgi:hypothetical protein